MLVLIRWVGRLFKKEYRFLSRYERSHPHFFWFALIDAAVTVLLIFGGFQLYSSISSTNAEEEKLERSGNVSMSESNFVDRVKSIGKPVYWLGPVSGAKYSFNDSLGYVKIVTYLPAGSSVEQVSKPQLIVETYSSAKDQANHIHATQNASGQTAVTQSGMTVKYDVKDLTSMIVAIDGVTQVIEVEYPREQNESKLLQDALSLTLVK